MAWYNPATWTLGAARPRKEPARDSQVYPRIMSLGGWRPGDHRPMIKPTPANLRQFSKTPYARKAINRIKDPIVNLPWEIVPKKGIELNSELQRQADIATACIERPNHDDSAATLLEQIVTDMLVAGAGAYEHQIGADPARPLWIWPVDALSIQIYPGWSGKANEARYLQSIGYGNVGGISGTQLRNDELVYIRVNPGTDTPFGLGPLEVAFDAISSKLGVGRYANNLASNAQPENLLGFEGADERWIATFRQYWRDEVEGQGQMPIVATPKGAKVQVEKLRGSDDKALFIEWQQFLIREIFVCFGLSPMNGGIERDINRNTAEVGDEQDWKNAIAPTARSIAAHLTRETLNERLGFSQLQFRFIGLEQEDEKNLADVFAIEYQNNATTPNEYRERTRRPPIDGQWGDLTKADADIATAAAKGVGEIDDPALSQGKPGKKPAPKKDK